MMNQKYSQHILILSNGYPSVYRSLSGSFWKDQAEELAAQKCIVGLIATTPISFKDIAIKGVRFLKFEKKCVKKVFTYVFRFPNIPKLNFLESFISLYIGFLFFKIYKRKHGLPDVIHVHRYEAGLLAIKIKEKYGIPYVVTEHSSRFLYNTLGKIEIKISLKVFQKADRCIAVSESLSKILSNKYKTHFDYLPNIVDTTFFKRIDKIEKNSHFSFFSAGNLDSNKNHTMLIDAFNLFHQMNTNSKLYIAGEGCEVDSLLKKIKELNLENSVVLLGKLSRRDMVKLNNECHVFVLPSIKETFGVVLIEALSTGIPIISTNSGGPNSIITNKYLGEICDINIESLFNAMKKVYSNYDEYSTESIVNYVNKNFSKQKIISELLDIYLSIHNNEKN